MTQRLARYGAALLVLMLASGASMISCFEARKPRPPENVPASYRDVRESAGHAAHLGKVTCEKCHGESGFAPPPQELCASCHAKTTPLHHPDPTSAKGAPKCQDCHAFGKDDSHTPWNCMRCHDKAQNHVAAIGAHSDENCADCHNPHDSPGTKERACTECHTEQQTKHAGTHGCRDCHGVHEPTRRSALPTLASIDHVVRPASADARCEACHTTQTGKLHVDEHALSTGHAACTTCHQPHKFAPKACNQCHQNQPIIAASKHTCTACHDQHDGGTARACKTCHAEQVAHPNALHSTEGSCVGCHPPHDKAHLAKADHHQAVACTTCHAQPSHAKAQCLDCHKAHDAKPLQTAALCNRCHADKVKTTEGTGHAQCLTCHQKAAHAPATTPPPCATCHAAEIASAPPGHAQCVNCHQSPHAPKPSATCATCHQKQATTGHGTHTSCTTCHRPHGPNGVAKPPACESCHPVDQRKGLHSIHRSCESCHRSHQAHPSDDRATCMTCHKNRATHEPNAAHCATCHPFK
jgi:hypothetical protein